MDIELSQREIDNLVKASSNNMISEWVEQREKYESKKRRFKNNEIYLVQDYDLFYTEYGLEKLTANGSVLRRYAYKNNHSYKKFRHFMVIEDYKDRGVNMVSAVGVQITKLNELNYTYLREHELVFLVDASSLTYFCTV